MSSTDQQIHDGLLIVKRSVESERIRIALCGEMDLSNASTAESVFEGAFATSKEVVVDLSELEFLDSTGVALLVRALSREESAKLSFVPSAAPAVRRLLSLTGLDERMAVSPPEGAEPLLPAS